MLMSHFRHRYFRLVVNKPGKNRRKMMCNKKKIKEEQLPKHDYQEALLMDMKSKKNFIERI